MNVRGYLMMQTIKMENLFDSQSQNIKDGVQDDVQDGRQ